MKPTTHARLKRQFRHCAHQLQWLRQTGKWNTLTAEKRNSLLTRAKILLNRLRSVLRGAELHKLLATAASVLGFAFAGSAQTFSGPQTNPFGITGLDTLSIPTLTDLDNDGDNDLLVSNYTGNLFYFQNTGTAAVPVFGAPQTNPFGLMNVGGGYPVLPQFADIDGDGDQDLFVSDFYGDFHYFQNTGTAGAPAFAAPQTNPFGLSSIGYLPFMSFADMDNDGDKDLMTGEYYGNFYYFQNTGTSTSPAFGTSSYNPFGLAAVNYLGSPAFADLDGDGDFDMMSGDYYGNMNYFQNTGTAAAPAFGAVQQNPFGLSSVGYFSNPAFADMDGDGDMDLFSGEYYGDLHYFTNTTPVGIATTADAIFTLYPVPATNWLTIETKHPVEKIELFNPAGARVYSATVQAGESVRINLENLPAGIYQVMATQGNQQFSARVVKL